MKKEAKNKVKTAAFKKRETVIRLDQETYQKFKSFCGLQDLDPLIQINEVIKAWTRSQKKALGEVWLKENS